MKIIINRPLETQALYRPRNRGNSNPTIPLALAVIGLLADTELFTQLAASHSLWIISSALYRFDGMVQSISFYLLTL